MQKALLFIAFHFSIAAWAGAAYHDSGLLKAWSLEKGGAEALNAEEAFSSFIDESFGRYQPAFQWRLRSQRADKTHVHRTYALYYRGRRVADHYLDLHFNKGGWIELGHSNWKEEFQVEFAPDTDRSRDYLFTHLKRQSIAKRGYFTGRFQAEPVVWWDKEERVPEPAFEVKWHGTRAGSIRHFVAHELSGRILIERPVFRSDSVSSKAWKVSPFNASNDLAPDTVTIDGIEPKSGSPSRFRLKSDYVRVRRQVDYDSPGVVDIDPNHAEASLLTFTPDPDTYNSEECRSTDTQGCPNQRIDGVNVYYHVQGFRADIQAYFNTLGASPIPTDAFEPLEVYVNAFALDTDGNGNPDDESNNAGYFPSGCGTVGGVAIERCLIFLKPDRVTSSVCGNDKKFFDLAREALVVVHEYQHFVTDAIKELTPGGSLHNVGDALHEGYSDYFAASRVSELAARNVTLIGEYGFQNCKFYQREMDSVRPYENSAAEGADPHVAGLSWASGLWQLREELGREKADLLALKSIFFLSSEPGFSESVEALVKADQALNSGANVGRIRQLFYDEIRWGNQSGIFRDAATGVVEVGFRSCNSILLRASHSGGTAAAFGLWFLLTLVAGRRGRRRNKREDA